MLTHTSSVLQEDFSELLMNVPAIIAVLEGPEHRYVLANPLYRQIVGIKRNIIGRNIREVLPELEGQGIFELLDKVYDTGVPYRNNELKVMLDRSDDGNFAEVYFNFIFQPIRSSAGEIHGIFVHAIDVTDYVINRMKLERSEERFRSFVINSPVPTGIYIGREMRIQTANEAILQTWDKAADVIGKTFREALPELEGQPFYQLLDDVYTTGKSYQATEDRVDLFRNGRMETAYYNFTYKALKNEFGEIYGVINTGVEVTELVEAKNKIKKAEELLEQQVKLRTLELEKLNSDLTHTNEQLRQFAYVASHDLQEPLRKINIYSDRLANGSDTINSSNYKTYLTKIISSAKRMSNLIHDLLNFSRLESFENFFEPVNLNVIAEKIKEDFEMLISQKNASVIIGQLGVIEANSLHMNQLLYNLLGNALKFSRDEVKPVIEIASRILSEEEVEEFPNLNKAWEYREIVVSDNGIGFDQQFAKMIFVIFQRLHSSGKFEGTGIGLALCKKIVDYHDGEIFAMSKEGEGSVFHILLPVRRG